ncbi:aminoglycoside phosphotransferase family protein [Paractinoplanes atraurantiacus]|uniref:Predicted kinase, aminoglycoside phosphotransferase (APT) family n=1 Tax=Paractinoplanes atraurantiacus TaxID=1036182 RepID=A0A285JKI3_9ACTN|nr:aminoglycoside phosphotransferase family protein [Actinoplanes atraurantiacus]SNY59621.1 Predicted kinase, aminoglycoside phosphotransferase (APT) family [Actinoplanes atraurantiacus]
MIDVALAEGLLQAQFPQWAGLPLRLVEKAGSDHVIFRLGDELAVRLPRHEGAIGQAKKESVWLPRLAPALPLAVPEPVAVGRPGLGYPWHWSVARWLDGEVATLDLADSWEAAETLAAFLDALQRFPVAGAPREGDDLLPRRDRATREAIASVAGVFDTGAMTAVWQAALDVPAWAGPPVWFHGDFHIGNVLMSKGRVSAVIDFGGLGVGDPARDMMMAFTLMSAGSRAVFREALGADDATWARGRGWALAAGLNAYCSYAKTDARVAAQTTRQINETLTDLRLSFGGG